LNRKFSYDLKKTCVPCAELFALCGYINFIYNQWIAAVLYIFVALMWLLSDKRIGSFETEES
jgi:hypothetical protein